MTLDKIMQAEMASFDLMTQSTKYMDSFFKSESDTLKDAAERHEMKLGRPQNPQTFIDKGIEI